jgi:hypothetical protein
MENAPYRSPACDAKFNTPANLFNKNQPHGVRVGEVTGRRIRLSKESNSPVCTSRELSMLNNGKHIWEAKHANMGKLAQIWSIGVRHAQEPGHRMTTRKRILVEQSGLWLTEAGRGTDNTYVNKFKKLTLAAYG